MAQQIACVLFLQLDQLRIEDADHLAELGQVFLFDLGPGRGEVAGDVQVDVGVDALALHGRQQVIEPVESLWLEAAEVGFPDSVGKGPHVHVVEAHAVDPEGGQAGGQAVGHLVRRKAAAEAQVDSPEPDAAAAGNEMSVFDPHRRQVLAAGAGQDGAQVDRLAGRGERRQDKGFQLHGCLLSFDPEALDGRLGLSRQGQRNRNHHGQRKHDPARHFVFSDCFWTGRATMAALCETKFFGRSGNG